VLQTSTLPEMISARLPDSFWLLAVPDGHLDPQLVAFAARPLALHFSVSEISRVEQLVRLRRQLASAPLRTGV
jgi:hypothetical protein